jgi:hypothetical protein
MPAKALLLLPKNKIKWAEIFVLKLTFAKESPLNERGIRILRSINW